MKVYSGLVGFINNVNARQVFYLACSEMPCLSTEFKRQFGLHVNRPEGHYDVRPTVVRREHEAVDKI